MSNNSRIEWTEATWNPLSGCTKVSRGCTHCYAERMSKRLRAMGQEKYQYAVNDAGHWTGAITLDWDALTIPFGWKKPRRIFVNSMSDLFHVEVPQSFIDATFETMRQVSRHTYQVLTKRYGRVPQALAGTKPLRNVLVGFSVCTQADAELAIEPAHELAKLGWRVWVSYEPALERIDWNGWEFLSWLVCGCETGPGARILDPILASNACYFAMLNSIPFLMKKATPADKSLDDLPEFLRVREYPNE